MKKRIPIDLLRRGMYVDSMDCGWLDHPFWSSRFLIETDQQLAELKRVSVADLIIDTDRGCDVDADEPVPVEVPPAPPPKPATREFDAEIGSARRLRNEAQQLITGIFAGATQARPVNLGPVEVLADALSESLLRNAGALTSLAQLKNVDEYTFQHSVSVGILLMGFAQYLGLEQREVMLAGVGGLLHDVGKMFVPTAVLNKPTRLNADEFELIRRHPGDGFRYLSDSASGVHEVQLNIVHRHHERLDGSGYPLGLADAAIDRISRMSAIVDMYDALSSDRCYHRGQPPTQVLRRLLDITPSHLDAELTAAFIRFVGVYPVGSWVELSSGRVGFIVDKGDAGRLAPTVRLVFHARQRRYLQPLDLMLGTPAAGDERIVKLINPAQWALSIHQYL